MKRSTDARQILKNIEGGLATITAGLKSLGNLVDQELDKDEGGYLNIKAAATEGLCRLDNCSSSLGKISVMRNIIRDEAKRSEHIVSSEPDSQHEALKRLRRRIEASV